MGAAKLAATVLVRDPDTHQTVELPKGSTPEMRLAVLVTNAVAWEGGRVPTAVAKAAAAPEQDPGTSDGDDGQGNDDGGDDSDDDADPKPPAKKAASKRPASRGTTAAKGTGGQ